MGKLTSNRFVVSELTFSVVTLCATLALLSILTSVSVQAQSDVTIDGGDSKTIPGDYPDGWTVDDLIVGDTGVGTLTVNNGGQATANSSILGDDSGASGSLFAVGAGTSWITKNPNQVVGNGGSGLMMVSHGAVVQAQEYAIIAQKPSAAGNVHVRDGGSLWDISKSLVLARNGNGSLTVESGGAVNVGRELVIADSNGSFSGDGTLIVRGADSEVIVDDYVSIGNRGAGKGSVLVEDGGRIKTREGYLTYLSGSAEGTLRVTGAGSEWIGEDYLWVGYVGPGEATLDTGGLIRIDNGSGRLIIGSGTGGEGTFNIGAAEGASAIAPGQLDVAEVSMRGNSAVLVFNHTGDDYQFESKITGAGEIRHLSGGTHFTGDSTGFSGDVKVSGGQLIVEDTLSGDFIVNSAGTLGGSGRVGSANVFGTLAPGNSIGTLNVDGDVVFNDNSILVIEVDANGADQIKLGGDAHLDGELEIVSLESDENESVLGDHTIVSAQGDVQGTFDDVSTNYAFLEPKLLYEPGSVVLRLSSNRNAERMLSPYADSPNAERFAQTLDGIDKSAPGYQAFENALVTLKEGEQSAAVEGLSGSFIPASHIAAQQIQGGFLQSLQTRMSSMPRMTQSAAGQLKGLQIAARNSLTAGDRSSWANYARKSRKEGAAVWTRAVGSISRQDAKNNLPGVSTRTSGVHAGWESVVHTRGEGSSLIGGAFGIEQGRIDVDGVGASTSRFDAYSLALYGQREVGDLRLSGAGGLTWLKLDGERQVVGFGEQSSDYNAHVWSLDTELAYDLFDVSEAVQLSPLAGLRYTRTDRESYAEEGIAGLSVKRSSSDSLRGRFGAEIKYAPSGRRISLSGQVVATRELISPNSGIQASLLGGDFYKIEGQTRPKSMVRSGVRANFQINNHVEMFASYTGGIANGYQDHAGQIGIRLTW